jgi:hypothetical protein
MWWTFEDRVPLAENGVPTGRAIDGMLVVQHPDGSLEFAGMLGGHGQRFEFTDVSRIRPGQRFPSEDAIDTTCLSLLAFMNSPLLTSARELHPTRAERRRAGEYQSVKFIDLRRASAGSSHGVGESERAFNVRWIVSGHFRAQWYPSLQGHKLRWIEPYVKGPEDAPLKPSVYRVAR